MLPNVTHFLSLRKFRVILNELIPTPYAIEGGEGGPGVGWDGVGLTLGWLDPLPLLCCDKVECTAGHSPPCSETWNGTSR